MPQANVPYLLIANEDCRVDISEMDLTGQPGKTTIDQYVSFIGSYVNTNHIITTNQHIYLIDHTPDCGGDTWHVGGCRAYLLVNMLYGPINFALYDDVGVEPLIVAPSDNEVDRFDLNGRKIPSGVIPHGIYIFNGKKHIDRLSR